MSVPVTRKPAAARRAEIVEAAGVEFGAQGLAGARLDAIAARVGVTQPRVVQMFGSKRNLFLAVLDSAFDKILAAFEAAEPGLIPLGEAYRQLLRRDPNVGLVMLHGYAAAADPVVRDAVRRRYLEIHRRVARLTGADALQQRTFFATGLVLTVSTVLDMPQRRVDVAWSAWILDRSLPIAVTAPPRDQQSPAPPGRQSTKH